jgi:enoyl-CoA hydratase
MDYSRYSRIAVSREGRVLRLMLNRPEALNAVDGRMHEELTTIFTDVQNDEGTDVAVLTGAGKAFSAGGDINWLSGMANSGDTPNVTDVKRIVYSLVEMDKPVIARVAGPCVGLGATVALFCDIIIAAENARFGDPHVKVGVVAGDGGAVIWPQLVGYARAKQYLLTGDIMTAHEAERIGLINIVVPEHELDAEVDRMVAKIASRASYAVRWTKASINIGLKQLAHSIMESSVPYEMLTMKMDDHREALTAFIERRQPNFSRG